ncbi:LPS assembly lipoprotein LptE [Helicobacter japonicus]|uniref:Lipoprotein n=1 Tax=Helicobacter japonicus TaxID=425400 RepID=A0A4V6I4A8_9HELI|nr:LPS assembly lipoprotein LptE [Helicobacter japonicus]TLE03223.1 hypothetical protein LS65_000125 [Helicobacter japonicus]
MLKYMRLGVCVGFLWFCIGCGYKPVSTYAQSIFNDGVYVDIIINPSVPESGTSIKDAVNNAVIKRFASRLKNKQEAKSFLQINVQSITQTPVAYNQQGFVSYYRTNVVLDIHFENDNGASFDVQNSGYYDYSADFTSTIALDQYRLESINNAASMALDKFISQVAYYGEFYNDKQ